MLPGLDGTGDLFEALARSLSDAIEPIICVYPQNPALGYSDLVSIAESFLPSGSPYVLLGESFSGPISVEIASMRPEGLKGLILVNTFLSNPRPLLGKLISIAPDIFICKPPRFLLKIVTSASENGENTVDSLQEVLTRLPPSLVRARLKCVVEVDVNHLVSEISAPIQIIKSTQDWAVPANSMSLLLKAKLNVSEQELVGNHFILQCRPNRSAEIIEGFCRELDVNDA